MAAPRFEDTDYRTILWDERGQPYHPAANGQRFYLRPHDAMQYTDSPHAARLMQWARSRGATPEDRMGDKPKDGFFRSNRWDPGRGEYVSSMPLNAIATLGVGGLLAAPAVGALFGGPGAAAGAPSAGSAAGTVAPGVEVLAPGASIITGGPGAGAAVSTAMGAGAGAPSFVTALKNALTDPKKLLGLGAAGMALANRGGGGSGAPTFAGGNLEQQISDALGSQQARMRQSQPAFDALVRQAYGQTPMRYRGEASEGYQASPGPHGAYQYSAPRFGR